MKVVGARGAGRDRRGRVQSVDLALTIVAAFVDAPSALSLGDVARACAVSPAKAHRYLVSLVEGGLVMQDPQTARYALGPLALRLGHAALHRAEPAGYAQAELGRLRDEIGETVSLITWGERGPTVRATEDGPQAVTMRIRPGTVLSLEDSATGTLFRAFSSTSAHQVPADRALRDARRRKMTRTVGTVLPGVSAVVVPLLDADGHINAAVVAYGRSGAFDARWDGAPAQALRRFAERVRAAER